MAHSLRLPVCYCSKGLLGYRRSQLAEWPSHGPPASVLKPSMKHGHSANSHKRPVQASALLSGLKRVLGQTPASREAALLDDGSAFRDTAPSWSALQQLVEAVQEEAGWRPPDPATGPANAQSLRRTFGKGEPKLKLYRDSGAWCPYCEKVWLQLEEKQIPYTIEKINMRCYGEKPAEFTAKVPSGLLPVLEMDGELTTESAAIMDKLEARFPERPLMPPAGTAEEKQARMLMALERRLFGDWLQWLCQGWNNSGHRAGFIRTMQQVDGQLRDNGGPFFMGADVSMVDLVFAPFLERIAASILYYKGYKVRGSGDYPHIDRWFEAMEQRPAYRGICSDYYTHVHDLPPQLGGCISIAGSEEAAAAIDGRDGTSWHLPLQPLSAQSPFEPYSPGEQPRLSTLQAAARLVGNHEAVARFAARAVGKPGNKPVMAELADPSAEPGMEHMPAVDAGLRHVAHALLIGVDAKQASGQHSLQKCAGEGQPGALQGGPARAAAAYLRDRVGVPRDLNLPAARQLRAHLNWLIDELQPA